MAERDDDGFNFAAALDQFSRSFDFDRWIYAATLKRCRFDRLIELGAGTGRLVPAWVSTGSSIVAVESNDSLRKTLTTRYDLLMKKGRLKVLAQIEDIGVSVRPTILIAPYNSAFYFAQALEFASLAARSATVGVQEMLFDIDDLSDADLRRAFGRGPIKRKRGLYVERVEMIARRIVKVDWAHVSGGRSAATFVLFLHSLRDVVLAIQHSLPQSRISEVIRTRDPMGTRISLLHVKF